MFGDINSSNELPNFDDIFYDDTKSILKVPASEYLPQGEIAIFDQSQDSYICGYHKLDELCCKKYPAILFGDHSRVVKFINQPFYIGADGVKIIRLKTDLLENEFAFYMLKNCKVKNTGYNRHFKYLKMFHYSVPQKELQFRFLTIAHQADKSKFGGFKSQFIEMFGEAPTTSIGRLATFINGSAYKPEEWNTKGLPIIRIQNLTQEVDYNYYNGDLSKKVIINNGDILVSWSATLGVYTWNKGKALLNQHIFKVVFDKVEIDKNYFIYTMQYALLKMQQTLHGSTMRHVVKKDFDSTEVPYPSLDQQRRFGLIVHQADKSKCCSKFAIKLLHLFPSLKQ